MLAPDPYIAIYQVCLSQRAGGEACAVLESFSLFHKLLPVILSYRIVSQLAVSFKFQ